MQVAVKTVVYAEEFTFSHMWTPPRTVLNLSVGSLALLNIEYVIADVEIAVEDLLIGLSVLKHLRVDTRMLLDELRDLFGGNDCDRAKEIRKTYKNTRCGHLRITSLNGVGNYIVENLH